MDLYYFYLLIGLAVILNWEDRPALALSSVVGFWLMMPTDRFIDSQGQFYLFCGLAEAITGLIALRINTQASQYVAPVCGAMVVFHFLGWSQNGYHPHSPYHLVVKIAEYAEIIACVVLSKPFLRLLKNEP